jgi:molybdenum cofactor biosynthesis protein B
MSIARDLRLAVVTFSDSRTEATDTGGALLASLLEAAGHLVVQRRLVREDEGAVRAAFADVLATDVDAVITTGGTGIAPRDIAIDVLEPLFDKRLDGFGEAFRRLSWDQVGARSLLSRATAGTARGKLVVALPGSEKAIRLGINDVLLPFLPHAIALLRGDTQHRSEKK